MRRTIHAIAVAALAITLIAPAAQAAELTNEEAAAVWRAASCPSNLAETAFLDAVEAAGIEPGEPLTDDLRALADAWVPHLRHVAVRFLYPPAPWPLEIRWDVSGVAATIAKEADRVEALVAPGSTWIAPLSDAEAAELKVVVDRVRTTLGLPLASDCTAADDAPAELGIDAARAAWLDAVCPRNLVARNEYMPAAKASGLPVTYGEPLPEAILGPIGRLVDAIDRAAALIAAPAAPWPAAVAAEVPAIVAYFGREASAWRQASMEGARFAPPPKEADEAFRAGAARVRAALGIEDPDAACKAAR